MRLVSMVMALVTANGCGGTAVLDGGSGGAGSGAQQSTNTSATGTPTSTTSTSSGIACATPPGPVGNIGDGGCFASSGANDCVIGCFDGGGNSYSVECEGDSCGCMYNDTALCRCAWNDAGCTSGACCPEPWHSLM